MMQVVMSSPDNWTKAVFKAQEAQTILVDCVCSSLEVWEAADQRGLQLLDER
jgi:hypothetical protein